MEEYVDESVKVCEKKGFGKSYDKEQALQDEAKRDGIQQGIQQEKIEIAKNLLSLNIKIDDIMKATGLTIEEIEKLKQ